MKLEELEAILSRVREEYSEDRWITLIDPCGDSSSPDTYEAGYNAACGVLRMEATTLVSIVWGVEDPRAVKHSSGPLAPTPTVLFPEPQATGVMVNSGQYEF